MDGDAENQKSAGHDYDGVIVKEHCQSIVQTYISKFEQFEEYVKKLLAEA